MAVGLISSLLGYNDQVICVYASVLLEMRPNPDAESVLLCQGPSQRWLFSSGCMHKQFEGWYSGHATASLRLDSHAHLCAEAW
jgi:hypothetical protein